MESLYLKGVHFIDYFQTLCPEKWQQEFFFLFSHIGDPRNAFIIYFPLVFAFKKRQGTTLVIVASFSEWLNLVLKWCLRGERPYWWVYENNVNVSLKQFYLTCETGPGSPSGHVMVTCAIGVFLVLLLTEHYKYKFIFQAFIWWVYLSIVCIVSLSRIYIASHFPHQIIFALLIGNTIGYYAWKDKGNKEARYYFILSLMLIILGLFCYKFLTIFFDPAFSIPKALKWCANKSYIRLDTTPLYSMVRDAGVVMAIGITQLLQVDQLLVENGASFNIIHAILAVVFAKTLEIISLPSHKPLLFYTLGFLKNCGLVFAITTLIPNILSRFFNTASQISPKNMNEKFKN